MNAPIPLDAAQQQRQHEQHAVFPLIRVDEMEMREPDYIVSGLIEADALALIFGDPSAGKSFIGIDMAASVATGQDFHGLEVKSGPVIYLAGEGHNGFKRRTTAWERSRGVSLAGAPFFAGQRSATFLDAATARSVALAVDAVARSEGMPRLIVVDTVARAFGAGDENSAQDMGAFICAMDDLRARYPGCTVLLVHHSGHAEKGRARGASALRGALDIEFKAEKTGDTITLENTKMKDGPTPAPMVFKLQDISIGTTQDGDPITSAALTLTDAKPRKTGPRLRGAARIALDAFLLAKSRAGVSDDLAAAVHLDDWRDVFYERSPADSAHAKKVAFQRARTALVAEGHIIATDDFYRLARIPEGQK